MPNVIELRKNYASLLDEVYKMSALTAVLDGPSELVRDGANANEILIPKMSMQGLANYDKAKGYVAGDVTLQWETRKCEYDRGRMFNVDAEDNIETAGIAFGRLAGEFERTMVVPELDAYRLAAYATKAGTKVNADLKTGEETLKALQVAKKTVKDAEVNTAECVLFISMGAKEDIDGLDTIKSRKVMEGWASVVEVPSGRFYDAITLTAGEAGGFTHESGNAINFMIVPKSAVVQFQKHAVPKIITPEQNQDADAWKFGYRNIGIADVLDNKKAGIYVHTAARIL